MPKKKEGDNTSLPRDLVPRHLAVIMDGNGRWARRRRLPRRKGHQEGGESVRVIVRECANLGVEQLTLYAFSTENWKRPKSEVYFLMRLLERFLEQQREDMMEKNIRLRAVGRLSRLAEGARRKLEEIAALTSRNTGMILRLALNYGGRQEIIDAAAKLIKAARNDKLIIAESLTEKDLRRHFYDPEMTDPDLLIRTGGEVRLSNFLLWQLSYAELWFTKTCWPEFRAEHLRRAFRAYAARDRRYGGIRKRQGESRRAGNGGNDE